VVGVFVFDVDVWFASEEEFEVFAGAFGWR